MNATNFIFDNKSLNDFGFIICEFGGESNSVTSSNISYTTLKTPDNDRQRFLSSSYDDVIIFNFSIAKYESKKKITPINSAEDRAMRKWLCKNNGFREFSIEQEGFEGIYYNAQINLSPYEVAGELFGYKLTIKTDNKYGYSEWKEENFDISSSSPYNFTSQSDEEGYLYPIWEITPSQSGNLCIKVLEDEDQTNTVFHTVDAGKLITIDSENGIVEGTDPNNFNWIIPRFIQDYEETNNTITSTLPCHIKLKYRLAVRAVN